METSWLHLKAREHAVQFYQDERLLTLYLSNYVGSALAAGNSAVVIATASHRRAMERTLAERGLSLHVARRQGRYVIRDAADSLARFVASGRIDETKFIATVDDLLHQMAQAPGRRIAVFGEMVALLVMAGNSDLAVELEALWNRALERHPVSLCCAYPTSGFTRPEDAAPFLKICAKHTHVFAAEPVRASSDWPTLVTERVS